MPLYKSPLLWPIFLKKETIFVLDETLLPFEEKYIEVRKIKESLEVLESMKTRAFGQVLLFFYTCCLEESNHPDSNKEKLIEKVASLFKEKRPTFDFLFLAFILKEGLKRFSSIKETVEFFLKDFDSKRRNRQKKLAEILPPEANILSICNVNGELIYLYEELLNLKKKAFFYICETRPYLQGSRLTFWELRRNNIPCKLICDCQCALLMKEKKINCVVVGADRSTKKGGIINKIGTYTLATLAHFFDMPFYALVQYPQDVDVNKINIEFRPQEEAFMFLSKIYDVEAIYPAFDITPQGLITDFINLQ